MLHDIGAAEALRRHGSVEGRYQELEGPAVARDILAGELLGLSDRQLRRLCARYVRDGAAGLVSKQRPPESGLREEPRESERADPSGRE